MTGNKENLSGTLTFYQADIRNEQEIDNIFAVERPDYVIHQAAQVSVSRSLAQPVYDGEENILATINILKASYKCNVKKLVFASTAAIYGVPKYLPINEQHSLNPISFYGLSKMNAESYIRLYAKLYGLRYTILRYANVYGMRQDTNGEAGVIAIYVDKLLNHENPIVYGDGRQTRDFIFVKDVAKANVQALTHGDNETFNISNQSRTSILEVVEELTDILQIKTMPIFKAARKGDIRDSYLSNEKARAQLQWEPKYTFVEGLAATVNCVKLLQSRNIS